ncbi:BTB/POZ domain-containing protein At1g50280-like [Hordeum vulgare subsp. vulgare]|uniref:NPH3 domain-containing protein n=1 Tax=Hordeum vulgare subsp. vulgare TaxID=112509 RepID=A0A8I6XFA6_HORVV|nr:BTB/POZ domain-containing protein At1g50280-like [Hordeum vulgare subsp. vulgare]
MDEACDLKVRVNGRHTLLLHQSVVCAFSGRLRAMAAREKKAKGRGRKEALVSIELDGFPGGGEGFELVARFCYGDGRLPPLRPADVPLLHCAAAFLEMTEEVRAGNLLAQAEAFVDDGLCYWTWADVLAAVKSCESFAAYASGLQEKLLSALFSRTDAGAETPKSNCSSSSTCSSSSQETVGGRPSSAAKTPESVKPSCLSGGREWWFDDVASLSPPTLEKAMKVLGCHGADNKNLTLTRFLLHYLRRTATLRKANDSGGSILAGLADTAVHGVALAGGGGAFSCRGLFSALRTVSAAGLSRECRRKLETLVGRMLDQATLDDLLVSGDGGGVYDVSLVMRLVRVFVSSVEEAGSPSSSQRMRKAGRLVDKYLAEISPDQGLRVSRFLAVAESLPDSARDCYDGVYRALDIYLESHAELTVEERATLCRCLNYEKLTLEACKDLARNRRIPPRIAVQALSLQRPPDALKNPLSSPTPKRVVLDDEKEKEVLRLNLRRMQGRVAELEMVCKEMRGQMKLSPRAAAKGNKALAGRGLPWMC